MSGGLRIVRALPFLGAGYGGPVAQAARVSAALAARGHDVAVISTDLGQPADAPRGRWHERDGARCLLVPARGLARVPPYAVPRAARQALAAAVADADVATVNVGLSLWGPALARACRRHGVPFVYNAEGALDPLRLRQKRLRKLLFLRCCERAVLRAAGALQAVTEHEADALVGQGAPRARVHVIPNGVPLPPPPPPEVRRRGRARLGLPADATVVLFCGRIDALKGTDLLLAAAAPLLRARPQARLAFVGPDGGALAALRAEARRLRLEDRVRFGAAVAGDALAETYAAADVFALTSRSEGLPNAALEAAAAGLPLLLTDACHLPEVREYGAGVECAVDAEAIAAGLAPLLDDDGRRRTCGAGARRMAAERFALDAVVDRLERLYRELADGAA